MRKPELGEIASVRIASRRNLLKRKLGCVLDVEVINANLEPGRAQGVSHPVMIAHTLFLREQIQARGEQKDSPFI